MYGGHITDDWDRRLCRTYLGEYMKPELVRITVSSQKYCCLVSSFGLLVSFQLVIGILQHFSIALVSYKSLVFLLV